MQEKKRGQVSIELLMTIGFALLMIIPITLLLYEHGNTTVQDVHANQAYVVARKVTQLANEVFYLGYPAAVTLRLYMPEYVVNVSSIERTIILEMEDGSVITSVANVNLSVSLDPNDGVRYITIAAGDDIVNVSQ